MSRKISLEEFQAQVKPLRDTFLEKQKEISNLQKQFGKLVNSIKQSTEYPDDVALDVMSPEFAAAEQAYYNEQNDITAIIQDLTYDFDLDWSGSFEEGNNSFWQPSNC